MIPKWADKNSDIEGLAYGRHTTKKGSYMKPNQQVIDTLKYLLGRAKSGEIQGAMVVTLEQRDTVGQIVAGNVKKQKFRALGGLEVLKSDLLDGVEPYKEISPEGFEATIAP